MKAERWHQVRDILDNAIALTVSERSSYLDETCRGDPDLRQEVESLLLAHEKAGTVFLNDPAVDLKAVVADASEKHARVGRRIGVYQIVEEIGRGGMGEVYRAVRADDQYQKQVAIKVVRRGFDTESGLRRFKAERQILATLDHPNIARLLDSGSTEDGLPYVVMELVEGQPIDQYCDGHNLSLVERLQLFRMVCAAVHYAHQHLVVHRDLKPGDILVTEEGVPKLLDFGIAKLLAPEAFAQPLERTATLMRVMTPDFASPEQVRGENITTASDIYSLGVVLYRLLTGCSPYRITSQAPHEIAREICESEPQKPSIAITRVAETTAADAASVPETPSREPRHAHEVQRLRRRLAGDLDNIVLMALRKEPLRRYASAEQFSEDIRRHLAGLPVVARKDTLGYRTSKFVTRHKLGVTAAALVFVFMLAGMAAIIREAHLAAVNGRRAEQRFNDVRQLANSLMFEVHDSIQDLPGATAARRLIVQRSLEYLNRLATESSGDVSLQRELANAYERIGRVQGNPEGSNLGDIAGALDSFGKALSIREKIANPRSDGNPEDSIALAASYREMCGMNARYLGNIGAALDYCHQALDISERLSQAEPASPVVKGELAKVYEAIGRVYGVGSTEGNAGNSYKALENHRKALRLVEELAAASPGDPDLSSWQGSLSLLTADDLFETGRVGEALPLYQRSTQTFEELVRQSNNVRYQDALLMAYQRMGDMLLVSGHFAQSLPYYRKEVEASTKLAGVDPKSLSFRNSLAASYATYGHALWRAGHVPESLASFRHGLKELADSGLENSKARGLKIVLRQWMAGALEKGGDEDGALDGYLQARDAYRDICASDPKDVEDCLNVAGTQDRIARIYIQQGKIEEALAEYQKALALSEPLSGGAEPNLEALYTVVNVYYGMGEVYVALAQRPGDQEKRTQSWKQARGWYQKSRAAFLRIPEWLPITPNEFDSRPSAQIEARLLLCQSVLGRVTASRMSTVSRQ